MADLYAFKKNIAKKYGVNEAIVIHRLVFYIEKNIANDKHFYDGNFWIFNSKKAWMQLFDFYSESQMKTILQNLIKKSAVKTGIYNKTKYDRTLWYSIIDYEIFKEYGIDIEKYIKNATDKNNCSIGQISPMDETELSNQSGESVQPIPEANTEFNKEEEERCRAPLFETKKSTYENINSEYNEFERYIVSHYVELTGKPIMDIRQIPEFKTEQGRQILRTAFDNRKNDWGIAIDNALESTSKSNREFRWFDFMKSLYLNLSFVNEEKAPPKTEKQLKREKLYEALKNRFGDAWEERYKNAWKPSGDARDPEFSDFFFEVATSLRLY